MSLIKKLNFLKKFTSKVSPSTISKSSSVLPSPCGEKRLRKESNEKLYIDMELVSSWLVSPEDVFKWEASIIGPANCPFEGGVFAVSVELPSEYPYKPPVVNFKTKIFHPNINEFGEISIDILGAQWSPALRVDLVLLAICSVLAHPVEPFVASNPAVKLYMEDKKGYEIVARAFTVKYAKP